jgi:hypothetical protein
MTQTFTFTPATRRAVRLKLGIDGPSGSGKTKGALAIAHGITRGGRIAVADSENGSAALYSDRYAFDHLNIPDADPKTYRAIIDAAVAQAYDALIIDSLSHAWLNVLAAKDDYDRAHPQSNPWTNWRLFGPQWEDLMAHLLHAPIHIIGTMRSKQAYEQIEAAGKKKVVKLGLQPQVREGAEYEFSLVFSVEQNHLATATKDRTELFANREVDLCDPALHEELFGWMNAGGPMLPSPARAVSATPAAAAPATRQATPARSAPASAEAPTRDLAWAKTLRMPFKKSPSYGKLLSEFSIDGLEDLQTWIADKRKETGHATMHEELYAALELLITDARAQQGTLPLGTDDPYASAPAEDAGGGTALATEHNVLALTKRITALLENEKLHAGARESIKQQLAKGDPSIEELLQLLGDIEADLQLPF